MRYTKQARLAARRTQGARRKRQLILVRSIELFLVAFVQTFVHFVVLGFLVSHSFV